MVMTRVMWHAQTREIQLSDPTVHSYLYYNIFSGEHRSASQTLSVLCKHEIKLVLESELSLPLVQNLKRLID